MTNTNAQQKLWKSLETLEFYDFYRGLEEGADPFLITENGESALGLLLKPSSQNRTSYHYAEGRKMLDILITKDAHLHERSGGMYPFQWALLSQHPLCTSKHFKMLLNAAPKESIQEIFGNGHKNQSALAYCFQEKWINFARSLISKKADPFFSEEDGTKTWTRLMRSSYEIQNIHRSNKGIYLLRDIIKTQPTNNILEDLHLEKLAQQEKKFRRDSYSHLLIETAISQILSKEINVEQLEKTAQLYSMTYDFPTEKIIKKGINVHFLLADQKPFWFHLLNNLEEKAVPSILSTLKFSSTDLVWINEFLTKSKNRDQVVVSFLKSQQERLSLQAQTLPISSTRRTIRL